MFNKKVNGYTSKNHDYINYSLGAPAIKALDIHNCGTTIQKYNLAKKCNNLPLQKWCSPNVAVESFAMRPIVNSKEYFESIKKYFSSIIYTDSIKLKQSGMSKHSYNLLSDYGVEPQSSFLQTINLEVTNTLISIMGASCDHVEIFKNYNPLSEGLVVTDINIDTYQCTLNPNHFYHKVLFDVFNTSRYNTISVKADLFQDTTNMMKAWDKNIKQVMDSKDITKENSNSVVYVAFIDLLNNTNCVLGQESDCVFKGYNLNGKWSNLLNENTLAKPSDINWLQPDALGLDYYTPQGNYDVDGQIKIVDNGPSNIDKILENIFSKSKINLKH